METLRVVSDTVDGDTFADFVERDLLPVLQPFNGTNHNGQLFGPSRDQSQVSH